MLLRGVSHLFLLICIAHSPVFAENTNGVLRLGDGTFDKIVPKHKYVLVKFDEQYPPSEKDSSWKKLAATVVDLKDLLLAEMHLADYGDDDSVNGKIAKRYRVSKTNYPVYKLFVKGKADPVELKGTKEYNDLKRFVVKETSLWIDLPGCLKSFNKYAKDFMKATDVIARQALLDKASALARNLPKRDKKLAQRYLDTMTSILSEGDGYVLKEIANLSKAIKGSSDGTKLKLRKKLDILYYFKHVNIGVSP